MPENRPGKRPKRPRHVRRSGSSRSRGVGTPQSRPLRFEWLEDRQMLSAVTTVGNEFGVNTTVSGAQDLPQTAKDSAGDYVVVWQSYGQDGSDYGIYAQRYNAANVAQGAEFKVNTYTTGNQTQPVVAMDSAGDFVVAWSSQEDGGPGTNGKYGVYAQRYTSSGTTTGSEFLVNNYTVNEQRRPTIAMDSVGDFVIAWQSYTEDGSGWGIYAQYYSSAGASQGNEFRVNTSTTNMQQLASVAMDAGGDFVVTWSSFGEDGSDYGIYGQRYNSSGVVQGSEFRVNTDTVGGQKFSAVAMDATGDFVVTWTSYGEDGSNGGIYAQLYSASGAAQGSEFHVNTYTTGMQNLSGVSMDSAGDFVVIWASNGEDGSGYGVYTQYYAAGGTPVGSEQLVNTFTAGNQGGLIGAFNSDSAGVALGSSGNFTVVWSSAAEDGAGYGVYAQDFGLNLNAPVVDANDLLGKPTVLLYTVESGPEILDPNVTVTDSDSTTLVSATVSISSGYLSPQDNLEFTNQNGIQATFNPVNGQLVLTGIATPAQYATALDSITYTNTSQNPQLTSTQIPVVPRKIVTYTVNDGGATSFPKTSTIEIDPGPLSMLAFATEPAPTLTTDGDFTLTIEAADQYGNLVNTYTGNVTIALDNNPSGSKLNGTLIEKAVHGLATFPSLSLDTVGTGYTLMVNGAGITGTAVSSAFSVVLGPAIKISGGALSYGVETGKQTLASGLTFTDPESATILNATVTIASGYTSPEDALIYANQNGILGSFNVTTGALVLTGSATVAQYQTALQSIQYIDTSPNPSFTPRIVTFTANDGIVSSPVVSRTIDIIPGTATQLLISSEPPGTVSAGSNFGFTVIAEDSYGNLATGFTGLNGAVSITLDSYPTLTTLGGTTTVNAVNGTAKFTALQLNTPGSGYTLDANSGALSVATTNPFDVVTGTPTKLVIITQPAATVTAGSPFTITVAEEDSVGNITTNSVGNVTVALQSNPGATTLGGTLSVPLANGEAVFSDLTLNKAATGYTLRASSASLSPAISSTIAVTPAAVAMLAIGPQSSTATAGSPFNVTVDAEDPFGNLVSSYAGSVSLTISNNPGSSTLGGTVVVNVVGGLAKFATLTLNKVGTGYTLVANSGSLTAATTAGIQVVPGAASQLLVLTRPPNITINGKTFAVTVEALDAEGNVATGFSGKVTASVSTNPGGASLDPAAGPATISAASGLAVFSGLSLTATGNAYTLLFTGPGVSSATSSAFNVEPPGVAIQLSIAPSQPTTVTAGTPFTITVDAVDGSNSPLTDTSFNGTITLALANNPGSSTLGGTVVLAAVNGVAVFSTLTLNKVSTGYTLLATNSSLAQATSKPLAVIAGAATQLIVAGQPPATVPVFSEFGLSVIAEDAEGNLATSFSGNVTVALATNPAGATLDGTLVMAASGGVAEFSDLTTNIVGTGYTLGLTSDGLTPTATDAFAGELATLTIAGDVGDQVTIAFSDSTDFVVIINGGAAIPYSTSAYDKVVYNGLVGGGASLVFSDGNTSNAYAATQSLDSTVLTSSSGAPFEFDADNVGALYIYVANPSSTATVNVTSGTGSNFYVDATGQDYSYIADPVLDIYSELSGFGSEAVSGSGGSTYAYVYSTSHAIVVGDPSQTTVSYGSVTTQLSDFSQLYTVGASDGTDSVTLHTGGGSFVGTPSFDYVSGTSHGQTFLIGTLYCATVTTFATNATDSAFFYSYAGNTFNGAVGSSNLIGSTSAYAQAAGLTYLNFSSLAEGFQTVSVEESGTGKDVANLTATGSSVLTTTPNVSTLSLGKKTVITVDTNFLTSDGTYIAVLARINVTGTSTDTANLYDSVGANSLVAKTNSVTLVTPVNTVNVKQFGTVNAYASGGTSDSASQQAVDIALSLVGNWKSV